jgi:ABC-type amino acid transport substrate-binding protein
MSWSPEFRQNIVFSDQPLFQVHVDVYRSRQGIATARELPRGATLGTINGYEYPDAIYALAAHGAVLERNSSEAANLKMLASGRIDAAVMMTSEFEDMPGRLRFLGVEKSVAFAFRAGELKSYIGFSRINPRGEEARRAFNRGYAIILANHTRDRIRQSWMKLIWR